ncbi:hypothetical protein [Nocardiopsis synnemataformans]|uniref:hypothetical protein n=1 Tax=Nocardiopsis synnemataformans TaxID=61305 RepID=UPI003EB8BD34
MHNVTEIRIHHVTEGDFVSIDSSWMNASDHEYVAEVAKKLTECAEKLRRLHEEEAEWADL